MELAGVDYDLDPLSLACARARVHARDKRGLVLRGPLLEPLGAGVGGQLARVLGNDRLGREREVDERLGADCLAQATAVKRRASGASRAIAASSVASGRMPSTTERPSYPDSAGRSVTASSSTSSRASPNATK